MRLFKVNCVIYLTANFKDIIKLIDGAATLNANKYVIKSQKLLKKYGCPVPDLEANFQQKT